MILLFVFCVHRFNQPQIKTIFHLPLGMHGWESAIGNAKPLFSTQVWFVEFPDVKLPTDRPALFIEKNLLVSAPAVCSYAVQASAVIWQGTRERWLLVSKGPEAASSVFTAGDKSDTERSEKRPVSFFVLVTLGQSYHSFLGNKNLRVMTKFTDYVR